MSGDILFDNIIVTEDEMLADQWAAQTYDLKREKIDTEAVSSHLCFDCQQRIRVYRRESK